MKQQNSLISSFISLPDYQDIFNRLENNDSLHIYGYKGSETSLITTLLFSYFKKKILLISSSPDESAKIQDELISLIDPDKVDIFSPRQKNGVISSFFKNIYDYHTSRAIQSLLSKEPRVVITSMDALKEEILDPDYLSRNTITLRAGSRLDFSSFLSNIESLGYVREDLVEYRGDFTVRGGIVDIFPVDYRLPIRIDFWGDDIISISEFDVETQVSGKNVEEAQIIPTPDLAKLLMNKSSTLLDYIAPDTIVIFNDLDQLSHQYSEEISRLERLEGIRLVYFAKSSFHENSVKLSRIAQPGNFVGSKDFLNWFNTFSFDSSNIFILCDKKEQRERLERILSDYSFRIHPGFIYEGFLFADGSGGILSENQIYARQVKRKIHGQIHFPGPSEKIDSPDRLRINDFVVHQDFGIGKYLGLKTIDINGSRQDCLHLEYAHGDKIFVPVSKFYRVHKYKTSSGLLPRLTQLRTAEWEKTKQRTRKSTEKVARDLVKLYAERFSSKGIAFSEDDEMQLEMEAEFVFDETPDQLRAIDEIKQDMMKPYPMDRLICGDVGFGKTEVAMRAAFKAVTDSYQVAVLCPTTILTEQHYRSFKERFRNYPIQVASLSRMKTRSKQNELLRSLAEGKIDILIGTHRILSPDVRFKRLGLLIIDEEHRFGVKQKERLKQLRKNLDVLSLSATPIPRSLQFSLIGARDFSRIMTPPKDRQPIITEIITFNRNLIRKAISYEIRRGGQVFFIHNNIRTINHITELLMNLLPDISFQAAHGRMKPKELEKIMLNFVNRKFDCLVSTTIIESGIDIPNVNTIIINRADRMGLAQLYQLRGRVGRSGRRAYAYLIIPSPQNLKTDSIKRIQTIARFTELGAGFEIARKDLEIRGAGNLFGTEQSGFITNVGLDLYLKILRESIDLEKERISHGMLPEQSLGALTHPEKTVLRTEITCEISNYLPPEYIHSPELRVEFYQRLSAAENLSETENIKAELVDRFGALPIHAENLLKLTEIRILSSLAAFHSLHISRKSVRGRLINDTIPEDAGALIDIFQKASVLAEMNFKFLRGDEGGFFLKPIPTDFNILDNLKIFLESFVERLNLKC